MMKQKEYSLCQHNEINILEYIYIFKSNKILFFGTWIFVILSSIILQFTLPRYYETQAIIKRMAFYDLTKNISDVRLNLQSKKTLTYSINDRGLNIKLPELELFFKNGMLRAETSKDGNIIHLKSRNTNPQMAAEICNAIAKSFVILENRRYIESRFTIHRMLEQSWKEKDAILSKINEFGRNLPRKKTDVGFLQNQIDIYNGILKDISARIFSLEEMDLLYREWFEILQYAAVPKNKINFLPRYFVISIILLGFTIGFFLVSLREFWVNYNYRRDCKE